MEIGSLFKLTDAYRDFIKSRDCSSVNSYPSIYRFVFELAFGGCDSNVETLNHEYQKIMSLSPKGFELLGFGLIIYPFLLIGIHKSVIYGKMLYTDKLISIAKRILNNSGTENEGWLVFYEKIYTNLRDVINNTKDKELYVKTIASLSEQVSCEEGIEGKYKCKVLAILGDLQKFDEIQYEKVNKGLNLRNAIDSDLKYISSIFNYHEKLKLFKNNLTKNKNEFGSLLDLEDRIIPILLLL